MSLAVLSSRALVGLQAPEVCVEVHLANGLPAFALVGLPDVEVREARDRVRAALQTGRFEFPQRRITVNLAPADLPKEGGWYTTRHTCLKQNNPYFPRKNARQVRNMAAL